MPTRTSALDATLRVTVERTLPLWYREGAAPALDRPAFVRAGSGVTWWADRLAVVQDDTAFVALVDPRSGVAEAIMLPVDDGVRQFSEVRGNKARKADLESVLTLPDGRLLAFGSGSTAARERLLVLGPDRLPRWVSAAPLYRALRAERAFAGSELNVEGAALLGDRVRLFQRGNGAVVDGVAPVNATVDLALDELLAAMVRWMNDPSDDRGVGLADVVTYALGAIDGVALSFTDATAWPASRPGRVAWLAAAEDSPDTYRDGVCAGSALGYVDPDGAVGHQALRTADGALFRAKAEGLVFDRDDPTLAWAVLDLDDPARPSELCALRVVSA
jgi:hypothetical protein